MRTAAGWCGHCQAFSPIWKAVAANACAASNLKIGAVDCVKDDRICVAMGITAFPSIRVFTPRGPRLGQRLTKCENGCSSAQVTLDNVLHTARALGAWTVGRGAPPMTAAGLMAASAKCAIAATRRHPSEGARCSRMLALHSLYRCITPSPRPSACLHPSHADTSFPY